MTPQEIAAGICRLQKRASELKCEVMRLGRSLDTDRHLALLEAANRLGEVWDLLSTLGIAAHKDAYCQEAAKPHWEK